MISSHPFNRAPCARPGGAWSLCFPNMSWCLRNSSAGCGETGRPANTFHTRDPKSRSRHPLSPTARLRALSSCIPGPRAAQQHLHAQPHHSRLRPWRQKTPFWGICLKFRVTVRPSLCLRREALRPSPLVPVSLPGSPETVCRWVSRPEGRAWSPWEMWK